MIENIIWLAGLMDGEGCIHCHLVNKTKNTSTQIQIHCASKLMIDEVESIYKQLNIVYKRSLPFWQPKSTKETHRITVCRKDEVVKLLKEIEPYLRVKKLEAKYVIDFYENIVNNSIRSTLEEREKFDKELKRLKRI